MYLVHFQVSPIITENIQDNRSPVCLGALILTVCNVIKPPVYMGKGSIVLDVVAYTLGGYNGGQASISDEASVNSFYKFI
jgi:hypothetical protein